MLFCRLIMIAYTLLWPFTSLWRHFLHHFRWWATDSLVSLAAVFWMSRNALYALRDIQKTAARETTDSWELAKILTDSRLDLPVRNLCKLGYTLILWLANNPVKALSIFWTCGASLVRGALMDNFPSVIYPREDIHSGKNKNHKQKKFFEPHRTIFL